MKRPRVYLAIGLACWAGVGIHTSATAQMPSAVAFVNVTVIPMDSDRIVGGQTVVVRASIVESVQSAAAPPPAGALVIDGAGKFLLPGLVDMHVHLPGLAAPSGRAEAELFLYVANGVTTVRSMAGSDVHLTLRDRVNAGDLVGPTLYLAGPGLDGERVKAPDDGVREVRQQKERGYDLLKILPGLSRASYDAIVTTAREAGMPFAGHVPVDVGVRHAIESHQQTIEHLDGYLELLRGRVPLSDQAIAPLVAETKAAGVWNVPTMAVMAANVGAIETSELTDRPELEYIGKDYIDQWLALLARSNIPPATSSILQANRLHLLKALNDAGARILLGTDSPQLFNAPGFSMYREMAMMVEAGMTPYQVLRAATQLPGQHFKRACGTVTPGACADLILLEGNPLRDLRSIEQKQGVMVHGRWLPASEIQRRLTRIRDEPGNYRLRKQP
jgi:imidazolonepropionase-like amidohydrolase